PFYELMMILELEVIDKQHFAVLIGKDYGDFTIRIVETESNAIGERLAGNDIQVLPNPATAQVMLRGLPRHCEISLYDISGRLLSTYTAEGGQAALDVSGFPGGILLVKVLDLTQDGYSYRTKIVVQ
ncbi:MAG: T9SS type A sorting domain-containing protein, partial [Bacteroidota bacterium]